MTPKKANALSVIIKFVSKHSCTDSFQVFIVPDDEAEISENFTIRLLPDSIVGDAVITSPDSCVITIQANDEANGILAIDFSNANTSAKDPEKKIFIFHEDETKP